MCRDWTNPYGTPSFEFCRIDWLKTNSPISLRKPVLVWCQKTVCFDSKDSMNWVKSKYAFLFTKHCAFIHKSSLIPSANGQTSAPSTHSNYIFPNQPSRFHRRYNPLQTNELRWKIHLSQKFHTSFTVVSLCIYPISDGAFFHLWKTVAGPYLSP